MSYMKRRIEDMTHAPAASDPEPAPAEFFTPDEALQRLAWFRVAAYLGMDTESDDIFELTTTELARFIAEEVERREAEELHRDQIEREVEEERNFDADRVAWKRQRAGGDRLTQEEERRRDSGSDDWPF